MVFSSKLNINGKIKDFKSNYFVHLDVHISTLHPRPYMDDMYNLAYYLTQ